MSQLRRGQRPAGAFLPGVRDTTHARCTRDREGPQDRHRGVHRRRRIDSIGERLDPESVRSVMARYFDVARTALERHGGTIEKFIGDAVVAVFGHPRAARGRRASSGASRRGDARCRGAPQPGYRDRVGVDFAIRTGVNTGEVVAGDAATGGTLATGDAMNVAARFEHAAGPGEVLLGERTFRLVKDAVEVEPVEPFRGCDGRTDGLPHHASGRPDGPRRGPTARRSPRRSPRGARRRPRPVPDEREPRRRRASTRSTGRIRSCTDGACVNGRSGLGQAVESAPLRAVGWRPHRQQEGRGTTPETTAWREPPRR